MNRRFKECLSFVLRWEGDKADDKADRGGRTAYGITQRTYDSWRINNGKPTQDVWDILMGDVEQVYYACYWQKAPCPILPEPLDLAVFDAAVQHGPKRAIKLLQTALGVAADGVFGPESIDALHEEYAADTIADLAGRVMLLRDQFYADIIARDSSQLKFQRGWGNRMASLRLELDIA